MAAAKLLGSRSHVVPGKSNIYLYVYRLIGQAIGQCGLCEDSSAPSLTLICRVTWAMIGIDFVCSDRLEHRIRIGAVLAVIYYFSSQF